MSFSNSPHVPSPKAPQGTLPFGASHVDHPSVPPGCLPENHSANQINNLQDGPPSFQPQTYNPADYASLPDTTNYPPPPQRISQTYASNDDPADPTHYMRNPTKLIAYLIPFPTPNINVPTSDIPRRFMIYTPPPPPLHDWDPSSTTKEPKIHKVQRKWESQVRAAKSSTAKPASWKGVKSKATKGINWAMNQTTSSNLDFLGRVSPTNPTTTDTDAEAGTNQGHASNRTGSSSSTPKKTAPLVDEMILVYPTTMGLSDTQMREEFVNTMLRTKSKAQRDAVLATGLLPVAFGIDMMLTLVWPFGGLVEIDGLWGWSSFRGAKTARSVTKRLSPSNTDAADLNNTDQLRLTFLPSQRLETLTRYLTAECHKVDGDVFPGFHTAPTETQVLEAIGWSPEHSGGATRNWEDEEWETNEVKEDVRGTFHKAAKEWKKWALLLEKEPGKATKK